MLFKNKYISLLVASLMLISTEATAAETLKVYYPYSPSAAIDLSVRRAATLVNTGTNDNIVVVPASGSGGIVALNMMIADKNNSALIIGNGLLTATHIDISNELKLVSFHGIEPTLIAVNSNSSYGLIKDLYARAKTNEIYYGSSGVGSYGHYSSSIIANNNNKIVHVPYKNTSAALLDLLSSRLDFLVMDQNLAAPMITAGKIRIIAVNYNTRLSKFPEVSTLKEQNIDNLNFYRWEAIFAHKHNNSNILLKLSNALNDPIIRSEADSRGVHYPYDINLSTFISDQIKIFDNVKKFVQ